MTHLIIISVFVFAIAFFVVFHLLKGLGKLNQKRRKIDFKNKYPHYVGDEPHNKLKNE